MASVAAPVNMKTTDDDVHPPPTSTGVVPAAGGCYVFVRAMRNILGPTDMAAIPSSTR